MSADTAQSHIANGVSSSAQAKSGDLQQVTPTFSYAQAAKGRSPSVPSQVTTGKATPETAEVSVKEADGKRLSSPEAKMHTTDSDIPVSKSTMSEGHSSQDGELKVPARPQRPEDGDMKDVTKSSPESEKPSPAVGGSQRNLSTPSSPEYGTTSTSTIPKEDDLFSTPNVYSDTTSDKQSQTSQNGNTMSENADAYKEPDVKTSWEEEGPLSGTASAPATISLKEALPPAVNIWQQRAQAKSKGSSVPQSVNSMAKDHGVGSSGKGSGSVAEPKKQDSRKKAKAGIDGHSSPEYPKDTSRSVDAIEKNNVALMAPLPPSNDAISWPTPDTVVSDSKKQPQEAGEKGDKDASQAPKPHGKKAWVAVPYVPTAVFNTPLPQARRGGRGGNRGSREGGARGGNVTGNGSSAEKPVSGNERSRGVSGSSTSNLNHSKSKRSSSAGPVTPKEQRKSGDVTASEKRKEGEGISLKTGQSNGQNANESRRPSVPTSLKDPQRPSPSATGPGNGAAEISSNPGFVQNNTGGEKNPVAENLDSNLQPGASFPDSRSEGLIRPHDSMRDFPANTPIRGESRPDRGRGGYRGRGGNNYGHYNPNSNVGGAHASTNGHPSHYQQSSVSPSKSNSNHDRFSSQFPSSTYQPPTQHTRNHRTNSRSQSIPHSNAYGSRFANAYHAGPSHLANLQTDLANEYGYMPGHPGTMSANPFNPYMEQMSLFGMVTTQMDYYFSVDNLCKDMYLRSRMDSQGFVFLDVLAKFNRIKQLTDDRELVRYACIQSPNIEFHSIDGIDRVRRRDGWQQWVRPVEERDASAQNDGPALQRHQYPYMFDTQPPMDDRHATSPRSNATINPMDNPQYQSFNVRGPHAPANVPNAASNVFDTDTTQTPLSAAVSEFLPSARTFSSRNFPTQEANVETTTVFTDAQVDNLHVLVRRPINAAGSMAPPFHSTSSRTFSNGSIDGRSIQDELSRFAERSSKPTVNGDVPESDNAIKAQSPKTRFPPTDKGTSPPVLWIKDRRTPVNTVNDVPNELTHESYHEFRQDALKQRETAAVDQEHDNMQSLYHFWSHFLIRNFNANMYDEFRQLAFEDATQRGFTTGIRSLLQYYEESILSQKTVSNENIARDFIDLVKFEASGKDRPAFAKLRQVWRNGAFNMKNRSKLTKFVDTDLKVELER